MDIDVEKIKEIGVKLGVSLVVGAMGSAFLKLGSKMACDTIMEIVKTDKE